MPPSLNATSKRFDKFLNNKILTVTAILMCALGAIFYCYEYYLRVAPSVIRTELKQTFVLGEAAFGQLVACYYYAYMPMQIPIGIIIDRFGFRRMLTLACFLCALGSYIFSAASHILLAEIGRFLIGFGSGFAYVGVLKISNVWLPQKYFALIAGICTTLGMFGAISGEFTISYLVEIVGWQTSLYYSAIVGIILTLVLWLVLRDSTKSKIALPDKSANNFLVKFVYLKKIVLSSQIWISGIIGCLTFLPISGFAEVWAVSFLQIVGMSKHQAIIGSSMIFLGFASGGPVWGILSEFIQSRRIPLITGSFVSAALMALIILVPTTSLAWMYPLLFFSAFFSSAQILIFVISNDLSCSSTSATAAAFSNTIVMIGGTLLPTIIGKILDSTTQWNGGLSDLTVRNYSTALMVLPISLIISGILSLTLKETYKKIGNIKPGFLNFEFKLTNFNLKKEWSLYKNYSTTLETICPDNSRQVDLTLRERNYES